MPLTFFEPDEVGNGSLEFANEYLKAHPKEHGKAYVVEEVSASKKGNGYMLKTVCCMGWLWKKSKLCEQLLEALEVMVKVGHGSTIVLVLDKDANNGFKLAADHDVQVEWFFRRGKYTTEKSDFTEEEDLVNPFLPASIAPMVNETLTSPQPTRRRRQTSLES